jgi:hypothetical protein
MCFVKERLGLCTCLTTTVCKKTQQPKIRGLNEKYEAKHGGKDQDTNRIFSLIAKKGMERKEKVKLMYSCQNGITDKSFNRVNNIYP